MAALTIATTLISAAVRTGTGLRVAARRIRARGLCACGIAALHVGRMISATGASTAVSAALASTAVTSAT